MIKTMYENKGFKLNDTASISELILVEYIMRKHVWSDLICDRNRMSRIDNLFDIYSAMFTNTFPTGVRAYLMARGYRPSYCHESEHLYTKVPLLFEDVAELDSLTRRLKKITTRVRVPHNWVGYFVYQEQAVKFLEKLPDGMTTSLTADKPVSTTELYSMYSNELNINSTVIDGKNINDCEFVIGSCKADVVDEESTLNSWTVLTGSFQNVNLKYRGTSTLVLYNCKIKGTLTLPVDCNLAIIGHVTIDSSNYESSPIVVSSSAHVKIQGESLKLIAPKGYSCLSDNTACNRLGETPLLKCEIDLQDLFAKSGVPITFGIYGSTVSTYNIQCNVRDGRLPKGIPTGTKMFRTVNTNEMDYMEVECG